MTTKMMNPDPELNPELHAMVREMGGRVLLQAPGVVGFSLRDDAGRFLLQVRGDRVFVGESGSAEKMIDVASLTDLRERLIDDGVEESEEDHNYRGARHCDDAEDFARGT